jgi:hypothetical protein
MAAGPQECQARRMRVLEIAIALLLGGACLAALSRRIGTPYPALVAVAGAALALIPGKPMLVLEPDLALTFFVVPFCSMPPSTRPLAI